MIAQFTIKKTDPNLIFQMCLDIYLQMVLKIKLRNFLQISSFIMLHIIDCKVLFSYHCFWRNTFRISLDVIYKINSLEDTKNVVITIKSNDKENVFYSVYCQKFRVAKQKPVKIRTMISNWHTERSLKKQDI